MNWLKKCYLFLYNLYESVYLAKYYQSIDEISIYNWKNVIETNDFKYLSKTGKACKRAANIFRQLENQLIKEFGVSDKFLSILYKRRDIELMYWKQILKGDKSNQLQINVLEKELEDLQKATVPIDYDQIIIQVGHFVGYEINPEKMSVRRFYKHIQYASQK